MANAPIQLNFFAITKKTAQTPAKAAAAKKPPTPKPKAPVSYQMFTDGACKGNPGPSAVGILCKQDGKVLWEKSFYIGNATNNIAEYSALVIGLQLLLGQVKQQPVKLDIYADSQLMVFQVNGMYKTKSDNIRHLQEQTKRLLQHFSWSINYIPREQNAIADKLANIGLRKKIALPAELQQSLMPPIE